MGVSIIEVLANVRARIELEHDKPLIAVEARIDPKLVASVSCAATDEDTEEAIDLVCKHLAAELRRQLAERHADFLRRHQRTKP